MIVELQETTADDLGQPGWKTDGDYRLVLKPRMDTLDILIDCRILSFYYCCLKIVDGHQDTH